MTIESAIALALLGLSVFSGANPGRASLAGAGFMVLGAGAARIAAAHDHGAIWITLLAAAAAAALAGAVTGEALRRFDASAFALVTLAFSLAAALVSDGGARAHNAAAMHVGVAPSAIVLALCVGASLLSAQSRYGFAAGAMAAGVAGVLYAYSGNGGGGSVFVVEQIGLAAAVAVIGGRHSVHGPVLGTLALALIYLAARPLTDQIAIVAGVLLVMALIVVPDGLAGLARSYTRLVEKRERGTA